MLICTVLVINKQGKIIMVFKNFLSKAKDVDILASLPDGVILIDNDGKIEWVNDAAPMLLNIAKSEMLKLSINQIIESALDLTKQAVDSARPAVGRVKVSPEIEFYVEITAKCVDNFYVVCLRDVTQSYKTVSNILSDFESSKKISKDKNVFLVKLANELKSPIHSAMGFSQAMMDGLGGEMSDKQEKYIKIINKNSVETLYFLDKIFELSKTESNLFDHDFQSFDVVNSIQALLKNYEPNIKNKNLNLLFDSESLEKRVIFSDEGSFKVVFQNIMETSISLTDVGSICVRVQHPQLELLAHIGLGSGNEGDEKSYLMLSVSDTGAGISDNDLNVIFEPYAQLDRSNKKNIVRSIALASAKNLINYLKGAIWVVSEPMQGSTYSFIIPIEKG